MNKPHIAFIGRVAHQKTGSDQFLLNVLEDYAEVTLFRCEQMKVENLVKNINNLSPQLIIFYQLPPSISKHLMRFKCKNFVWVPMWDGFKTLNLKKRFAFRHYHVRVLCFSRKVYDYTSSIDLNAEYFQYFPELRVTRRTLRKKPPYTILLWQRDLAIGLEQLVNVVGEKNIGKVILKGDFQNAMEEYSFAIEPVTGWLKSDDYLSLLDEIDFYFAPRFQEGIGFSFLEALARGIPVIGHDDATMNEYLVDGINSLLFDKNFNFLSKLTNPAQLQYALIDNVMQGRQKWCSSQESIQSFILSKS